MADIIQAAKWMQEGKEVRCRSWAQDIRNVMAVAFRLDGYETFPLSDDDTKIRWDNGARQDRGLEVLTMGDLLADDWEIAE